MRITRDEYLMNEVLNAAKRSTCLRLNVGAVLVRDGRPILAGYNGALSGFPHCTPETCNETTPCTNTVHAEANVIYFAARHGIATAGATLWCTDSPCKTCAEAIIQAEIKELVYLREYRATPWALLRGDGTFGGGVEIIRQYDNQECTCGAKGFTKTQTGCYFCEGRANEDLP